MFYLNFESHVEYLNSYVYSPAVGMSVSPLRSFLDESLICFLNAFRLNSAKCKTVSEKFLLIKHLRNIRKCPLHCTSYSNNISVNLHPEI